LVHSLFIEFSVPTYLDFVEHFFKNSIQTDWNIFIEYSELKVAQFLFTFVDFPFIEHRRVAAVDSTLAASEDDFFLGA